MLAETPGRCALCGTAIEASEDRLAVDLGTNLTIAGDKCVQLTPRRAEVLSVLVAAFPRAVSTYKICDAVFSNTLGDSKDHTRLLDQHVYMLNHSIRPLGFRVISRHKTRRLARIAENQAPISRSGL